jgi:beta-hydroxylase
VTDRPDIAFKILSRADWRAALAEGRYDGSAADRADGYIHLSAADQLEATAAKHYAGQADLMLVEVDLTALGDALIWEPSRGGALFPHIYGPLPVAATRAARALSVTADGRMILDETA